MSHSHHESQFPKETWLVTGSNRGIGLELVRQLVGKNKCVIASVRRLDRAQELRQIASNHPNCHVVQLDVADSHSVQEARRQVGELLGERPLDVLVNNAATGMNIGERASEVDPETILNTFRVNVVGPLQVTQAFLPLLRRSHEPRVIFMGSDMGLPSQIKHKMKLQATGYNVAKAGVHMVNAMFSIDDHCRGITFVAIHPGWVDTDMGRANTMGEPNISAPDAVSRLLTIVHNITPEMNGWLYDNQGNQISV